MDGFTVLLPISGRQIEVQVKRKVMKTCRLKVFPTMEVQLSVPTGVTEEWIRQYLSEKANWIENKLDIFRKTNGYASTGEIRRGMSVKLLGQEHLFAIKPGPRDTAYAENRTLYLECTDIDDQKKLQLLFEKWWRNEALTVYQGYLDRLYPIVRKYGVSPPRLYIRKMSTLWGSSSPKRGTITLNLYLLKARPACIEYVVLHELVHFLYPNHSKSFYDFLSTYLPDWKDRKQILDYDVVHGL